MVLCLFFPTRTFLFIAGNCIFVQPRRIVVSAIQIVSYVWLALLSFLYPVGEDAVEDEAEENPIVLEFQQEREAFYIKDPKKALQGFFDREGMYTDSDSAGKNVSTRGCFSRSSGT